MNAQARDAAPPPATNDGVAITPFVNIASVMHRNPLDEVTRLLHDVVQRVMSSEASKPAGSVTLTLKVVKSPNVLDAVAIVAEVSSKPPKEPNTGALLFVNEDGNLVDRNPNQGDLYDRPRAI